MNGLRTRRALAAAMLGSTIPSVAAGQIRADDQARFRTSGIEVTVRFRDDRVKPLASQIQEVTEAGLAHYLAVFGAPPRAADGSALVRLTVNVGTDRFGGGDAAAGVVSVLVGRDPATTPEAWKLALLHETFHLWSGESFRPAGPAEEWLHEGASEFYALQAAARRGVLDDTAAVRVAEAAARLYGEAPTRDQTSLMQAGIRKEANRAVVRHGGWLAMVLLDRMIRERTGNSRSMDDVMRRMLESHDRDARPYGTLDVARSIRETTGLDLTEFFARHVMGRLPLPAGDSLGLGALARRLRGGAAVIGGPPEPDSLLSYSLGLLPRADG